MFARLPAAAPIETQRVSGGPNGNLTGARRPARPTGAGACHAGSARTLDLTPYDRGVTVERTPRRPGPRSASTRAAAYVPLDRPRILAAALRLMDADGLDALSMRRLAAELDVEAMSLYHHVPGKPALLEGLAEVVLGEVQLPAAAGAGSEDRRAHGPGDPAAAVRAVARALRTNALAHPNAIPLLGSLGLGSPAARRHTEGVLELLDSAGVAPQAAFTTFLVVRSYVLGYVLWEVRHAEARAAGMIPPTEAGTLAEAGLPHLAPIATFITTFDNDAEFERGLDVLVAGLAATADR